MTEPRIWTQNSWLDKKIILQYLQLIKGLVNFAYQVVVPGRTLIRRLSDAINAINNYKWCYADEYTFNLYIYRYYFNMRIFSQGEPLMCNSDFEAILLAARYCHFISISLQNVQYVSWQQVLMHSLHCILFYFTDYMLQFVLTFRDSATFLVSVYKCKVLQSVSRRLTLLRPF